MNTEDEIESKLIKTYSDMIKRIEDGNINIYDLVNLKENFQKWYAREMNFIDKNGYISEMLKTLDNVNVLGNDDSKGNVIDEDIRKLVDMVNSS